MLPLSLGVPLAIISVIGLLMNAYIFLVVVLTKQVSANNILLLHLAIVDTLLCILFLAFSFPVSIGKSDWLLTFEVLCSFHGFILTVLHPMALWTICGLNCDRYYAIAAPLHYSAIINTRKVLCGLLFGWLLTITLSIPPFFSIAPFKYDIEFGTCVPYFNVPESLAYAITYTIITFIIPGVLIILCNIRVLMIARYHRHRIASAIYEVTLSCQVTITHQRNPFFIPIAAGPPKFRSRSPISSVLQLIGSVLLLYCPYYVTIMWNSTIASLHNGNTPKSINVNNYLVLLSSILLTCSSSVNGLLYGIKSKVMRKSFQNYWRKKKTKIEINHEIQARTPSTCGSRRPSMTGGSLGRPPALPQFISQRRLSETFLNIDRNNDMHSDNRNSIKRIASEMPWRPVSLTFSDTPNYTNTSIVHTASCNTLQIPRNDNEIGTVDEQKLYISVKDSFRPTLKNPNPRVVCNSTNNNINTGTGNNAVDGSRSNLKIKSNTNQNQKSPATMLLHKVLRIDVNNNNDNSKKLSFNKLPKDNCNRNITNINNINIKNNKNNNNNNIKKNCDNHKIKNTEFEYLDNGRACGGGGGGGGDADDNDSENVEHDGDDDDDIYENDMYNGQKSPRILITRAYSEDSEKTPSLTHSPAKEKLHRQYVSSGILNDRKWKSFTYKPQIDKYSNKGSDSETSDSKAIEDMNASNSTTISSDLSSTRRFSSLDEQQNCCNSINDMNEATEEQLLLSWPTTRKKYSTLQKHQHSRLYGGNNVCDRMGSSSSSTTGCTKQTNNNIHNKNGIGKLCRPNPLTFNDRCEEPEVIL